MSHPKCPICKENIKILDKLVSDVSYLKATIAGDLKLTRIIGWPKRKENFESLIKGQGIYPENS